MDLALNKVRLIKHLQSRITDKRVLESFQQVPRECFVPDHFKLKAYCDEPLPIGYCQTISQPLITAIMTQALELVGNEQVLEIGTGSGYQAAILAEIVRKVVTTERIPALADSARKTLQSLGYTNIEVHLTGSRLGWEKEAPYAGIIVSAASPRIPESLLMQLAIGGRMIIPVGSRSFQELLQVTRLEEKILVRHLGSCCFVPLIGQDAWDESGVKS